jgi:hypothetical protein
MIRSTQQLQIGLGISTTEAQREFMVNVQLISREELSTVSARAATGLVKRLTHSLRGTRHLRFTLLDGISFSNGTTVVALAATISCVKVLAAHAFARLCWIRHGPAPH